MTRVCRKSWLFFAIWFEPRRLIREYSSTSVCKRTRVTFPVLRRPVGRRRCGGGRLSKIKAGEHCCKIQRRGSCTFQTACCARELAHRRFGVWRLVACWHPKKHMYRYKYWQTMYNTSQLTCGSYLFDSGRCFFLCLISLGRKSHECSCLLIQQEGLDLTRIVEPGVPSCSLLLFCFHLIILLVPLLLSY